MDYTIKQRDFSFDYLKCIALFAIILAHCSPPKAIFQLRNFDVPLLLVISGALLSLTAAKEQKYWQYVKKRLFRLLLPAYTYVIIYYSLVLLLDSTFWIKNPYSVNQILGSFTLTYGYVWIVRIYVIAAFIGPLFTFISKKTKSNYVYLGLIFFIYMLYEILFFFTKGYITDQNTRSIVFEFIPYCCLIGIGVRINKFSGRNYLAISALSGAIFVAIASYLHAKTGHFILTQDYKYPPRVYYIAYALCISFLLIYLTKRYKVFQKDNKVVRFISSASLWIYFWHTILLYFLPKLSGITEYYVTFPIITMLSIFLAYGQMKLIDSIRNDSGIIKACKMALRP
jgi:peptidoglycan/LPS O-acetylase OafA/YrhL